MAFLGKADFVASIHTEILDGLTRNNDDIIDVAIDEAVSEMKGYLAARYNVDAIFNASGASRHPTVLNFCKDVALYHIHSAHNPAKIPDIRVARYERAIEWMKEVAREFINPDLPVVTPEKDYIFYGGNEPRPSQF